MIASRLTAQCLSRSSRPTWNSIRTTTYRRGWSQLQRRAYASSGEHGSNTHKASSDLPWAITSIVVTVPAAWYLIQPQIERYKKGPKEHKKRMMISHVDLPSKEETEEKEPAEAEESTDTSSEGASEEAPADDQSEEKDGAADDTSEEPVVGGEEPKPQTDEEETKEKKEEGEEASSSDENKKEEPLISGAKHPFDPHNNPEKSTKGEGVAETAKLHGTVDPARPQR